MTRVTFVDWEGRPAVIVGSRAWAVLWPGEGWTEVNTSEVAESGYRSTREEVASMFPAALRGAGGFSTIPTDLEAAARAPRKPQDAR